MSQVGADAPPRMTRALVQTAYTAAEAAYFRGQDKAAVARGEGTIPDGFTEIKHDGALGDQMKKADCIHLKAPDGSELVSFRGTASLSDWGDNVKQVAGSAVGLTVKRMFNKSPKSIRSEKYDAAAKIGDAFRDSNVTFTGHSLGGGLAKLAGEVASTPKNGVPATSKQVVSFNGAPVSPDTYKYYGCAGKDHLRTTAHIINRYDLLNRALKGGKSELTTGEIIKERASGNTSLIFVEGGGEKMSIAGHGLKAMNTNQWKDDKSFNAPAMIVAGRDLALAHLEELQRTPVNTREVADQIAKAAPQQSKSRAQERGQSR